ncbi:MAG: putative aminohydrolase SsnA [Anaerolineaceae bacterium]|nr:putative aminohydrolase SsnA [Anaerolineaceae bacterium]
MLITNANLITWGQPNQILPNYALYISDGKIKEMAPTRDLTEKYPSEERLDAHGQYVMPGNINAHGHYYSAYAVGISVPGDAPITLPTILEKMWWPFDKALTADDVRYSVWNGVIDSIKHGTTTLFDHHSSPNCIDGVLDMMAEVVDEAGLRSVLCFEVTDRDGPERAKAGIAENARFIRRCNREQVAGGRVKANFGIHAPMTISEDTMAACRASVPQGTGFHTHVAEHEYCQFRSLAMAGTRSVDRLYNHGLLNERSILAHGIHLDAREVNLVAQSGARLSHQPRNNQNAADGVAEIESYMRTGVKVCLGNDGLTNTMWREAEAAYFLQKIAHRDGRRLSGSQLLEIAIYNNAALASEYFTEARLGVIEPGAFADLIFVDYCPVTPMTVENLAGHFIFGFNESMITTTIVNGKVLMKDRVLTGIDEEAIKAKSREIVPAFWKRFEKLVPNDPILG